VCDLCSVKLESDELAWSVLGVYCLCIPKSRDLCIGDADLHNIGNFDIELPNWAVVWIFPALHYVSTITRHYR
jgi:hypothetical protein